MDIDSFIKEIEDNKLEIALSSLTGKDIISIYLSAKEFQRAKIQRSTFAPKAVDDSTIIIKVINSKEDITEL
jgi:hypothetical protein